MMPVYLCHAAYIYIYTYVISAFSYLPASSTSNARALAWSVRRSRQDVFREGARTPDIANERVRCMYVRNEGRANAQLMTAIKKAIGLERHTPVGRKGIRFLFRNPAAEPLISRALAREFVGATQKDLETPSGDPGRVFFSA